MVRIAVIKFNQNLFGSPSDKSYIKTRKCKTPAVQIPTCQEERGAKTFFICLPFMYSNLTLYIPSPSCCIQPACLQAFSFRLTNFICRSLQQATPRLQSLSSHRLPHPVSYFTVLHTLHTSV